MIAPNNRPPLVSICCITYNHAPYIKECIDGFLMQQTNFPVEILLYDDASTDGAQEIIREYETRYPGIIKPIYQTENQYSKGVKVGVVYNYSRAQGKYIALCEGDDYWIDALKLQKQVDFLEANPEYGMYYTDYDTVDTESNRVNNAAHCRHRAMCRTGDVFGKLVNTNFIQTLTVCFRKDVLDTTIMNKPFSIDLLLFGSIAAVSKCYYTDDIVGAYRINPTGAIQSKDSNVRNNLKRSSRFLIACYFNGVFPQRKGWNHVKILINSVDSLFRQRTFDDLFDHPLMLVVLPIVLIRKALRRIL